MDKSRKILITSALPYANGMLHLGHMLEVIQADIFSRFQKMQGNNCTYVCADDAHGTPIMLKAMELNISPEELIEKFNKAHRDDFSKFHIGFDCYHSTHSPENKEFSELIFNRLNDKGLIEQREVEGAYDEKKQMFLPDRFVKGTCPKCKAKDQNGDNCEVCGATYNPKDLINPISRLSDSPIVLKKSTHLFFKLKDVESYLKKYITKTPLQKSVKNKLNEWFELGLEDWDISRDAPYFGFEIPNHKGKYFYVWLDAPIGYIASYKKYCSDKGINYLDFWESLGKKEKIEETKNELYHFIGKDIVYFHALFWPALLKFSDFRKPNNIFVHGFLTVNGEKMSKSRGTFIQASDYLKCLDPEYLRYYFAAKLSNQVEDIDLSFDDFKARVNSDLIGKLVNIASRSSGLLAKNFNNQLSEKITDSESTNLINDLKISHLSIAHFYENREYAKATKDIMRLADKVNQYVNDKQPWKMIKENNQSEAKEVLSVALNCFLILVVYLKPVLPMLAKRVEAFLNVPPLNWDSHQLLLTNHQINSFTPLLSRIDDEQINNLIEISKK